MKQIERKTHTIDASGEILGRLASRIAHLLMGKHKVTYVPNVDAGDIIVVKNASKIKVTGNKTNDKLYRHHSMHPGGLKELKYKEVFAKDPSRVIYSAVDKMLPKNKLRKERLKRLTIEK